MLRTLIVGTFISYLGVELIKDSKEKGLKKKEITYKFLMCFLWITYFIKIIGYLMKG